MYFPTDRNHGHINAPKMSSIHPPDTLLEPTRPPLDPNVEEAVLHSINVMLGAVVDELLGHVWELPHLVHTSPSSPPIEIVTTDRHEFYPLPAPDFMMLHMVHASLRHEEDTLLKDDAFAAPTEYYAGLNDWAHSVSEACRYLTKARDHLWTHGEERIQCAGFCRDTIHPICDLQEFLLQGEIVRRPWSAAAFLISSTSRRRRGCIINTNTDGRRLTRKQVMRSEMLTLLALLEISCVRAVERGESSVAQTVFVLSLTFPQARVLEARMEAPGKMVVSIRRVLGHIPDWTERDDSFKTLVAWAMFTESGDAHLCAVPDVRGVSIDDNDTDDEGDESGEEDESDDSDIDMMSI
ncbi:hypothetical protein F4860DRAFT_323525 [Xylaria cubensis]|nr:hypothetical protein F4860DRAFT_323525 [Xylaria cubensis]